MVSQTWTRPRSRDQSGVPGTAAARSGVATEPVRPAPAPTVAGPVTPHLKSRSGGLGRFICNS